MEDNKPIDGAEYISLEDAKRLKLPYFEGLAAGYPSPAGDYQHESLDLNEKFVHHPEASYFVRVRGESMIGLGLFDGDICLADRSEEITDGNIVVARSNEAKALGIKAGRPYSCLCQRLRLLPGGQTGIGLQEAICFRASGERIPLSGHHRRELSTARLPYHVRRKDREGSSTR